MTIIHHVNHGMLPRHVARDLRRRLGVMPAVVVAGAEYGETARAGLLLHAGGTVAWIAPGVPAAPWWRVL